MARNSTQTYVGDQLDIRYFLVDDESGATIDERMHCVVVVEYLDDASGLSRRESITYKVADSGPQLPGSEKLTEATDRGNNSANNRFTAGDINKLTDVTTKTVDLAREKLDV
jgi:hypothetical protein